MTDEKVEQNVTADRDLPIGSELCDGHFTITDQLGAGGFGITYRAKDNILGRTVVIKECFPEDFCVRQGKNVFARSAEQEKPLRSIVRIFMREARSLAKLRHPNIVGVHRAFEENQTAYMALDLIDGRDLFDVLATNSKALSPVRVKHILMQMLDAIEVVHCSGLLHRDISPDNIIIEKNGTPVLIDFGAAKADSTHHTRAVSSLLVVKDGYSPQEFYVAGSEQAPCSDLYALGATFYHVLSGRPPVNSQARVIDIAGQRPDPCEPLVGRIKGYDEAFLQAIDDAMRIHPGDRLQSAAKWKALIADSNVDPNAPQPSLGRIKSSEISLELELELSKLVEETNDEVRKSRMVPVEPKKAPVAEVTTSKPEWVDEFNQESQDPGLIPEEPETAFNEALNAAFDRFIEDVSAIGEPAQGPTIAETNWIDRAREKQERVRSERAQDLNLFPDAPEQGVVSEPSPTAMNLGDEDLIVKAPPKATVTPLRMLVGLLLCMLFIAHYYAP